MTITTSTDLDLISNTIIRHFGAITTTVLAGPVLRGIGARNPGKPEQTQEENEHTAFEVYAAPIQEADDYFRAVRKELQEALGEGVILIERQEIKLI
jgi:hypothetical protein